MSKIFKSLRLSFSIQNTLLKRKRQFNFKNSNLMVQRCVNRTSFTLARSLGGVTMSMGFGMMSKAHCISESDEEINAPDPAVLKTEELIRNASFAVVESTTAFLSQVTVSLVDSYEQYTKSLYILVKLMEYRLKMLGDDENEEKIADLIIQARASVNKFKARNQELQLLYMSAYNLVTEASTAAYSAGSEFHSTVATHLTQSTEIHLSKYRHDLTEAEFTLRQMEANIIEKESEHAEKQKRRRELKDEDSEQPSDNSSSLTEADKEGDKDLLDFIEVEKR